MVDGLLERFSAPRKADLQILLKIVPERVHTLLPGLVILSTLAHRCGATPLRSAATVSGRASCSPRY